MSTWPSKDPDAVLDYQYTIPLDEGDAVATATFEKLSGDVVIDDEDRTEAVFTIRLSGGTDGQTAVFRVAWTTTAGRVDDDVITLFVSAHEYEALELTGYAKPGPAHLRMRYPAFASVDSGTIQYWLTDAERSVGTNWMEGDYAAGLMALAAHNMMLAGYGTAATVVAAIPTGVTSFKSGSFSATFTEQQANARATGDLSSTIYGQEYKNLLRRNVGGPIVGPTGAVAYDPYIRYPQGEA